MPSFDIFSRVIDNFGDAGVCWRLARQLQQTLADASTAPGTSLDPEKNTIRLFIDDLSRLAALVPQVNPDLAIQTIQGVQIHHWSCAEHVSYTATVVVEAFGCDLPTGYQHIMPDYTRLWINLEYLSAEPWVTEWHGLPSLQPNGLPKFFFFPGFTRQTGGLLREPDLTDRHQAWQTRANARRDVLVSLGLSDSALRLIDEDALLILLFGYADKPLDELIKGLEQASRHAVILIPAHDKHNLHGTQNDNVHVEFIPFVPQYDFDTLLWCCDINAIRGEDSLVRSLWAGHPMIWHIYPQPDNAHHAKLEAFLAVTPLPEAVKQLMRAWNQVADTAMISSLVAECIQPDTFRSWRNAMQTYSTHLATEPALVTRLLEFCAKKLGTG